MIEDSSPKKLINYRTDIQGIRGVAVLLVVLFHAQFGLTGGYIGVDIFFVISGYVITSLLDREIGASRPRVLKQFYVRRIFRLLPIATTVVTAVCIFGIFSLAPNEKMLDVAKLAKATAFFSANFELLSSSNYFSAINPLQHMWSLAVEEQFYLVFPALYIGLNKLLQHGYSRVRDLKLILTAAMVASFVLAVLLSRGRGSQLVLSVASTTPQTLAFYMAPTRAWEFLAGSLVALTVINPTSRHKFFYVFQVLMGSLMILFASFRLDSQSAIPGIPAVIPVVGVVLIVLAGSRSLFARQIYSWQPLCLLGNISYSWYLWHWPFIVFAETLFPRSAIAVPLSAVVSILPSLITYRYIENPFRYWRGHTVTSAFILFLVSVTVILGVATGMRELTPKLAARTPETRSLSRSHFNGCPRESFGFKCEVTRFVGAETVMLLGDSHAASSSDGVAVATDELNMNLVISTFDGCPPFATDPKGIDCDFGRIRKDAIRLIAQVRPDVVILSNALSRYVFEDLSADRIGTPFIVNSELEFIKYLVDRGIQVVVIPEVPSADFFLEASLIRPHTDYRARNLLEQSDRNLLTGKLTEETSKIMGAHILETDSIFCPNGICSAVDNGELLYDDPSHLSHYGSLRLVGPLMMILERIRNS